MPLGVHSVTFDCSGDPYDLGLWWGRLLERELSDDDKPGDPEAVLAGRDGSPRLLFIRVPEGKAVKNRVHVDLQPAPGRTRDDEVERAVDLGARLVDDRRRPDGRGWVVLADPDGNEFCIELSVAEYEATGGPA
jgi:hypothetical protein